MRRTVTTLLAAALLAATTHAAAQAILPREVRQRILQAVVEVVAYDPEADATLGAGSGTIVSPDGYVLTNFHVLDDGTGRAVPWAAIYVTDPAAPDRAPTFRYWARYVAGDAALDFALVQIVEDADENSLPPGTTFVSMPVGTSSSLIPGDPITVVGYPGISGATVTFTSGIVSGFVGENLEAGGKQWIKTDAKLARGNSGGGAFDANGVLVAVPTLGRQVTSDDYLESQDYLRPIDLAWPLLSANVAGLERVGGLAGQLTGGGDAADPGPSPLEVARSGAGTAAASEPDGASVVQGELAEPDPALDSGEYVDAYGYAMVAGRPVSLEVTSDAIDPYLLLIAPDDTVAFEVDDSAGAGLNVRETFVPATSGEYLVVVTSAFPGEVGPYRLRIGGAEPVRAGGAGNGIVAPAAEGTGSGFVGDLAIGASAVGELAAVPDAAAYHTYRIEVPTGTPVLTLRLEAGTDLDLFAKPGSEIASYADDGDWRVRDIAPSGVATLRIDAPAPGAWFVDVAWLLEATGVARYRLSVE